MSLNDRLKRAIDELDLDRRIAELKGAAGELAREHGDALTEAVERLGTAVDERTQGRYAEQVASVRQAVSESVAKVADLPPAPPSGSPEDGHREPRAELPPADPAP